MFVVLISRFAMHHAVTLLISAVSALREAVGPPPPDFARAARKLGVPEEKLRRVMHEARQGALRRP